jgi:hypothetical protein
VINNVALPPEAKSKLQNLELARMAAEDAGRAAAIRLNGLPHDIDPELRAALEHERDQQGRRHSQLHLLISRLNEWLARLRGVTLELALPPSIEQSGKDLSAAISSVRAEIAALHRELVNVRAAPLPASDASDLVDEFVAGLIRQGRPSVSIVGDRLRVNYRGDLVTAEDLVALLCWLAPGVVCAALERELPEQHSNALPKSARLERVSELETALTERETLEEALIEAAHGARLVDVLRRPDASPACVLGVRIAQAQAQVA